MKRDGIGIAMYAVSKVLGGIMYSTEYCTSFCAEQCKPTT